MSAETRDLEHEAKMRRIVAALNGIVSVEPGQDDDMAGDLSAPCLYCWQSGPLEGPPENRHAKDCEWIEARAALTSG